MYEKEMRERKRMCVCVCVLDGYSDCSCTYIPLYTTVYMHMNTNGDIYSHFHCNCT